ncbi:uncharacterized protein PgNI_00759, partial [Pyricularia grisea]|uniref:Uncharacterized protein n=1 Tax=Pyricularia grisea TaxID=148305 RepID=A0A6P8BGH1_PYRGI
VHRLIDIFLHRPPYFPKCHIVLATISFAHRRSKRKVAACPRCPQNHGPSRAIFAACLRQPGVTNRDPALPDVRPKWFLSSMDVSFFFFPDEEIFFMVFGGTHCSS